MAGKVEEQLQILCQKIQMSGIDKESGQVAYRIGIKRLKKMSELLGVEQTQLKHQIDFIADSPDIDILRERLIQVDSVRMAAEEQPRLLVDMDGTLAKFETVDTLETLYEKGYFYNLKPMPTVIDAVKEVIAMHPETEVFILSAVLSDSKYALQEKNAWLDEYLPEIDAAHRVFPPCGDSKLAYVPDGVKSTDYLLDDYTHNLILWEPPAKGIKLLNGINHTKGTWKGNMLRCDKQPSELAGNIVDIMSGALIRDMKPRVKEIIEQQYTLKQSRI